MADQKDVRHLPSPLRVDFGHPESKNTILNQFRMKNSFFTLFFREDSESLQISEISASNKSGKIGLYEVRAQKSATFDPPKPRPQNLVWDLIFKACHISLIFWIFDSPQNVDGDPSAEMFFVKFSKMVRKNNFEKKNGNRALPE